MPPGTRKHQRPRAVQGLDGRLPPRDAFPKCRTDLGVLRAQPKGRNPGIPKIPGLQLEYRRPHRARVETHVYVVCFEVALGLPGTRTAAIIRDLLDQVDEEEGVHGVTEGGRAKEGL